MDVREDVIGNEVVELNLRGGVEVFHTDVGVGRKEEHSRKRKYSNTKAC